MKYSIKDGPGIRTTVFLKGCPLHCWWCHNPESQAVGFELMLRPDRCIACGACVEVCPNGAVVNRDGAMITNPEQCQDCLSCVDVCHAEARSAVGRTMTVTELMTEIMKDAVFYEESGGGVTFSGGEPLLQSEFLYEVLRQCKAREIHTAVDTTGFAKQSDLLKIAALTDLFLYDVKLMDDEAHRKYTGVSNRIILENLKLLSAQHGNILVRIPVIPGVNDQPENMRATGEFLAGLSGVRGVSLLAYHKTGVEKYRRMAMPYRLPDTEPPSSEAMNQLVDIVRATGCNANIG
jgi:pyruvate formate lyase activating enzyme